MEKLQKGRNIQIVENQKQSQNPDHAMDYLTSQSLKAFANATFSKIIGPLVDILLPHIDVNDFSKASLIFSYVPTLILVVILINFEKLGGFVLAFSR